MTTPKWFACNICGLQRLGLEPVHGDNPCPIKVEEHEATMAVLEARKEAEGREGFAMVDMMAMLQKMTSRIVGDDDDDDD